MPKTNLNYTSSLKWPTRLVILLPTGHLLDPVINLLLGFAFEADGFAGAQESLDLLQAQFLGFVHVDGQSSACHPLQAHLVLESHLPFRLILDWIRLSVDLPFVQAYDSPQTVRGAKTRSSASPLATPASSESCTS
jgi:hypothetical protein